MKRQLPRITRQRFLAGAIAGSAGLGLYTWQIEPHWVTVVSRDLPIAGLPASLVGQTLIQISDLHVGRSVDADYLIAALKRAASLRPAMTVVTGDFMSCHGVEQVEAAARVMQHLAPGPLGAYAILGNHDYAIGWSRSDVAEKLAGRLTDLGIRMLRNQSLNVAGLRLVGLDDLWSPNFNPAGVLAGVNWEEPTLTLCHNPDAVDLPELSVCRGWILSGHTHGGQCKPPFLPPPLLPVKNRRYTSGEFDIGNGRRLYINRGLGHLLKVRFNARPEITAFKMVGA